MIALTECSLDDLVKPEMQQKWVKAKKKWFADESPEQQKTPGYLKEEFSSENGLYIGLSAKVNLIFCDILRLAATDQVIRS